MRSTANDQPKLHLVVGAARSGTTLLRRLLGSHPDIICPPEAGLPALMGHMANVWNVIDPASSPGVAGDDPGANRTEGPGPVGPLAAASENEADQIKAVSAMPASGQAWIRTAVRAAVSRSTAHQAKRVYIDKSLDSVHYLAIVSELFPETRLLLAFRHVMDTVASGLEASPWGFNAYGYTPFVQASPDNTVAALASYWLMHVSAALRWEREHQEMCHRVRYEDLVANPQHVLEGVQRFLDVAVDPTGVTRAFARQVAPGPGDYKLEHTGGVHASSIGRGKRVPVAMLPEPLLNALNEQLVALGYQAMDNGWNATDRPIPSQTSSEWTARLKALVEAMRLNRISELEPFAVLADDDRHARWIVDPDAATVRQGDGDVTSVLTGSAEDLCALLTDTVNLGVLFRSGRVRFVLADSETPLDTWCELRRATDLLRTAVGTDEP